MTVTQADILSCCGEADGSGWRLAKRA